MLMSSSVLSIVASLGFLLNNASSHSGHDHTHVLHGRSLNDAVRCGTGGQDADERSEANERLANFLALFGSLPLRQSTIVVPTYWHDIRTSSGTGGISTQMLSDSMTVLNEAFTSAGFMFSLVETIQTDNDSYYNSGRNTAAMKSALREGDATALNIYSTNLLANTVPSILGFATFPSSYAGSPQNDGVVIDFETAPGGSASPYNLGDTLVHEVGHWMGLFHVFHDDRTSCTPYDQVDDTPEQSTPTFGCPNPNDPPKDSCENVPGFDSTTNFMDYTDDLCMFEFTAGQIERMELQWRAFRATDTSAPSSMPSKAPSAVPSGAPIPAASAMPSGAPIPGPSSMPSGAPIPAPSSMPSKAPSAVPSKAPTPAASAMPSVAPTVSPSAAPGAESSAAPSTEPSLVPSAQPYIAPSTVPTVSPSTDPTSMPSSEPSSAPGSGSSAIPSTALSSMPSIDPTSIPTSDPSPAESSAPSSVASGKPTSVPSSEPSPSPNQGPTPIVPEPEPPTCQTFDVLCWFGIIFLSLFGWLPIFG